MSRQMMRQADGQWRRTSLDRDYGLDVVVCEKCGAFNPWKLGIEQKPETCRECGAKLDAKGATR